MSKRTLLIGILLLFVPLLLVSQQAVERVDLNVMHKIKTAELGGGGGGRGGGGRGAPIMETMYNLTDRYGPRLTNSPQFRAAGQWAVGQLKEWGLSNVQLEPWSSDMPGWQCTYFAGSMIEPTYQSLIGVPVAWTGGTNGAVTGEAILAQIQTQADMDKFHGKLTGKIVLTSPAIALAFPTTPLAHRYTEAELAELVPEIIPTGGGRGGRGGAASQPQMTMEERQAFQNRLRTYMKDEGVLLTLTATATGESGTL